MATWYGDALPSPLDQAKSWIGRGYFFPAACVALSGCRARGMVSAPIAAALTWRSPVSLTEWVSASHHTGEWAPTE
jgi:hypothetical protein